MQFQIFLNKKTHKLFWALCTASHQEAVMHTEFCLTGMYSQCQEQGTWDKKGVKGSVR